ncbi:MAG: type II secretion system protein [Lentisphaerae bacterium]|nr:type II secretion system protein [Lentisphaerota bacterium]
MKRGFTLIEIVLALMVVAIGLLAVFQLFPSGLRASYDATAETRLAHFGDLVMNAIRATAAGPGTDWTGENAFRDDVVEELQNSGYAVEHVDDPDEFMEIPYPAGQRGTDEEETVRYNLQVNLVDDDGDGNPDDTLARVRLRVRYGKVGGVEQVFYTEIYNMKAMP